MSSEAAFLAVLLRLMTFLLPSLRHLKEENPDIAYRFSIMGTLMLESYGSHPVVVMEAAALFESLAANQQLLPPPSRVLLYSESAILSSVPFLFPRFVHGPRSPRH